MTDTSQQAIPETFLWQWIFSTTIGYGSIVGLGLASYEQNPSLAIGTILSTSLWVSLLQWIVLRGVLKGASQWIWLGWLTWMGGLVVLLPLTAFLPQIVVILVGLFSYPFVLSLSQWLILKRCVQPSWWWVLVNSIAMLIGLAGMMVVAILLREWAWNQPLSLAGAIGGLAGGAIQGWISGVGLCRLLNQRTSSSAAVNGREKPPTPQTRLRFIITAFFFLCIAGWVILVFHQIPVDQVSQWSSILLLPLLLVYVYASILIHELGHLMGALACGFKLNFLTVTRFVLIREQRGLKLRRMRKMSAGGLTSTIPLSHHNLRKKLMILVAGGPIASFSLFLIGLILLRFPTAISQNLLLFALVLFAGFNLYLAITNSLPIKVRFYTTDGYIMSVLARNTVEGQRFSAMYEYLGEIAQGVRPRELSDELVARSLAQPEKSMHHGYGLLMSYYKALDKGDIDQAGECLDEALAIKDYIPEFIRASLFMEAAYFEAYHRQSVVKAQEWFDKVEEFVFLQPYTHLRVDAAMALAEGHYQKARETAQKGLESIYVNSLSKGMAIAEQDWLNQILVQSTGI